MGEKKEKFGEKEFKKAIENYKELEELYKEIREKQAWKDLKLLNKIAEKIHPEDPDIYNRLSRKRKLKEEIIIPDIEDGYGYKKFETVLTVYSNLLNLIKDIQAKDEKELDKKASEYVKYLKKIPLPPPQIIKELPNEIQELIKRMLKLFQLEKISPKEIRESLPSYRELTEKAMPDEGLEELFKKPIIEHYIDNQLIGYIKEIYRKYHKKS